MIKNKKNLIVTLADTNFIDQAKQLFASVYFKAGWQGDYLLLACDLSDNDKAWFTNHGILVYDCQPLTSKPIGSKKYPPIVLSKFYLFKEYFKQWQKIIFLDADIIVKSSLDNLLQVSNFGAVATTFALRDEFIWDDWRSIKRLKNKYSLTGPAFNSGVYIFDTDLIAPDTFSTLWSLYEEFGDLNVHGEEATINLLFYKNWVKIPIIYNSMPWHMGSFYKLNRDNLQAIIIHFVNSVKPWDKQSPYYEEWFNNLTRAKEIDLTRRPLAVSGPTEVEIKKYLSYLKIVDLKRSWRLPLLFIDSQIGRLGLFIKRKNPRLYKIISLKKND